VWQNWRHKFSFGELWDNVSSNWDINDLYLPAVGFAYRYILPITATGLAGSFFKTIGITWTIWIETSVCDPYPPVEKPLHSLFAQKVLCNTIMASDNMGGFIIMPGAFYVTDHPVELGFEVEDPPFEYPLLIGGRDGVNDAIDIAGDFFTFTWQSPGYDVHLPRGAKIHIGNRRYLGSGYSGSRYNVHTNTKLSKLRIAVAKDKERRLLLAEENNGQVEIKRSNKDSVKPVSLSVAVANPYKTQTAIKKSFPDIVVDNRGNVGLFYMTKDWIESLSAVDNKVGRQLVKITWPSYENIVVIGVQSREKPAGCFGTYKTMLCYRRIVGIGSKVCKLPYGHIPIATELFVERADVFTPGYATITDGLNKEDVYISTITYDRNIFNGKYYYRITLQQPLIYSYAVGSLLTQERFIGLLNSFGTWSLVGSTLRYPRLSVDINGCGVIPAGQVGVGKGRTYIFACRNGNNFYIYSTPGGQKSQTIGGKAYQVDNIPANSVLVAITENGVLDTKPSGVLIIYKCVEEFVGGTYDNTGRVAVLAHKADGTPIAAASENQGYNFLWERVGD